MAQPPVIDISSSAPSSQQKAPPSSHRLPTVSASDALRDLQSDGPCGLPSGIDGLDSVLSGDGVDGNGGFEIGKVTEIWGPSGAGKTAIMLETAANVLKNGGSVVWVDGSTMLNRARLQATADRISSSTTPDDETDRLKRFRHLPIASLSHLLTMILHPQPKFPPEGTSLLVVDGINTLVDLDYPRFPYTSSTRTEQQKWQASRRYAVLGNIVTGLSKLAFLKKLSVIVTTGCSTRMRFDSGLGAALVPGVGGAEWESGIRSRMVVFRDFGGCLIGVQKCQNKSFISREEVGEVGRIIGFELAADGALQEKKRVVETVKEQELLEVHRSPVKPRKRHFDEIADSDGEDVDEYGWADRDDDALVAQDAEGE